MDYSFKIINSSAGSGKTFNLAIEYICRLLRSSDDEHFKAMLALTFTNKASVEMKDRILIYLSDLKHQRNKIIQEIISNKTGLDQLTIKKRSSNILEKIRTPKVGAPIPKPLSIKEIEKIIEFKDSGQEEFTNTCVFILMYAAGLRVTEVISIKMGEIDLDNQTVKVTGKGNKQRVLPIYSNACKSLEHYINKVRPDLSKNKSYSSLLFVRKNLKQITRQYIWKKLKQKINNDIHS